jgi:hypothetical protein
LNLLQALSHPNPPTGRSVITAESMDAMLFSARSA